MARENNKDMLTERNQNDGELTESTENVHSDESIQTQVLTLAYAEDGSLNCGETLFATGTVGVTWFKDLCNGDISVNELTETLEEGV